MRFGPRNVSGRRFLLAGKNFHEGGLAGAVGPGNRVAAPGHEGGGDLLKEDPGAKAHGDVIDSDHILISLA